MRVRLRPDAAQEAALRETLKLCNRAANLVSKRAFETEVTAAVPLQRLVYGEVKAMGLSAQPAIHCVRKTAGAYAALGAASGVRGHGPTGAAPPTGHGRRPVRFRKDAAQPFDDRCLSWQLDARTVSIWTVHGRMRRITFTCSPEQAKLLAECRKGESDLVLRGGVFYLHAACEISEPEPYAPQGFLGADLGIVNIATTSDGTVHSGNRISRVRHRHRRLRRKLQRKGTKSAKRALRRQSGRETRFAADTDHRISKRIVTEAQRTCRGIALEDLGGIRERVRLRRPRRAAFHSWSFSRLGAFIAYKARRAGVPVIHVDPAFTSQRCSRCGLTSKENRPDQATFKCTSCGFAEHADVNAARNIAARAAVGWAVSHAADDVACRQSHKLAFSGPRS